MKINIFSIANRIESRSWYIAAGVMFKLSLEFSYANFVSPVFSYSGLFLEFGWVKYFESWFVLACVLVLSSPKLMKPSDYLINFLNFSFVTPLMVHLH